MRKYSISSIVLHYQPIVRLSSGEIAMYECLARFIDTEGNGLGPIDLEQLFEAPEFLRDLFEKTLPKIVQHAKDNITVAVNVDVCSLSDQFFCYIERFFNDHPGISEYIHFEITEKNIVKGLGGLREHIEHIRKLGIKVVLDDFGTGGANIECLEKIRFDLVKIDGQFLKAGIKSESGYNRLKLIVDILRSYETPIVGEHIENKEIEAIAKKLLIDYGQGHYYGMPKPIIETVY